MAEGIRKAMRDHQVSWKVDLADEVFVAHCTSCGYLGSELEDWEHQANIAAEVLAANGYGKLEDAWGEGFFDGKRQDNEGDDGPRFVNPYRRPE